MILYFTGTGNSRYIAEKIAKETEDRIININDKIKQKDNSFIKTDGRLIFVVPTYAWRIPVIVKEWILRTEFSDANQVWFVMNCGSEIGNAAKYNMELCDMKKFTYMGTAQVVMPENYIAMFDSPCEEEALRIISAARRPIKKGIAAIKDGKDFPQIKPNLLDKLKSGPTNPVFYSVFVKAKAFYVKDTCIGCGKCSELCPLNNIRIVDEKPVWGDNCTHCMACICKCPVEAIEYGRISKGKPRYKCVEYINEEQ